MLLLIYLYSNIINNNMADVKISALPTSPAIANTNLIPYTTGTQTRAVAVNSGNTPNTVVIRDASGNIGVNGLTANTVGQVGVTTFYGNGANLTGIGGVPTGVVMPFAGSTPPSGFLLCNGAEVSRSTYSALYGVLGNTWGAGNGSTTFNLPNYAGRSLVGAGTGSGLTTRSLGQYGGAETHLLTANESGLRDHTHSLTYVFEQRRGGNNNIVYTQNGGGPWTTGGINSGNANANAINAHNNMQPFAVINYIIKT